MAQEGHIFFGSLEEQERQRLEQENNDAQSVASQSTAVTQNIKQNNNVNQGFIAPQSLSGQNQGQNANNINMNQDQGSGIDFEDLLPPPSHVDNNNNDNNNNNNENQQQFQQLNNNNLNNVNLLQTIELSEEAKIAKIRQEEALKQLHVRAALQKIQLPTLDKEVKIRLRELKEPVCYFAEQAIDRRERLRTLCAEYLIKNGEMPKFSDIQNEDAENEEHQHFRYVGPTILKDIREKIVKFSLKEAALRIEKQKLKRAEIDPLDQEEEELKENYEASKYQVFTSQFGDTSAISKGDFSKDGQYYATGGGSGNCKVWTVPNCEKKTELNGHLSKVQDIKFHPQATVGLDEGSYANIVTCAQDQHIRLWTFRQDQEYQKSIVFKGHEDRVNKVLYHPSGDYLFSASHDNTWKYWDLETQKDIITQTGHAGPVYAMAVHPDGSLIYTGDFCGQGAIWDIRSGKNILHLQGHVKKILCADFNQNGFQLASGGDDNTIRFWDIRRKNCAKIVPAHLKLITDLKYQPGKSMFLTSVAFDNQVKVWNSQTFDLTQSLSQQESKVTGVSISNDSTYMATTSLDRKFTFWKKTFDD